MLRNFWINRNFFLIWSGQLISQLGDKFYAIALAWWVLGKTHSPFIMGLLMAASVLPGLILGPVAGGFIDRWNRKVILVITDLLRCGLVLIITLLSFWGTLQIWHIFSVAVIISLASAFYNPTIAAVLPQLVSKNDLSSANSLSQLIAGITTVLGPITGAAAIAFTGYTNVFLFNSVSFCLSGILAGLVRVSLKPNRLQKTNLTSDIKSGIQFILSHRKVLIILIIIGITHLYFGSLTVVMPVLARQLSGIGIQNLGLLEMMVGFGMILGSLLLSLKKQKTNGTAWLFGAMLIMGTSFITVCIIRSLKIVSIVPFIGLMALVGLAVTIASVYWASLLQSNIPNEIAGRVFGISETIGNTALPIAYSLFGFLLGYFSISLIMGICGLGLIIVSLVLRGIFKKATWEN